MFLLEALGIATPAEVDPTRPLQLAPLELGVEAAVEAARILTGGEFSDEVQIVTKEITSPFYWAISHKVNGDAEVFGFPEGTVDGLPTAIEVAIVRALAATKLDQQSRIFEGGAEISIGPPIASDDFRKIIDIVKKPLAGQSILFESSTQAILDESIIKHLNQVTIDCLSNSFRTSPLKFRFLEIYRMMEARFLAEIKFTLMSTFDAEPKAALDKAGEGLKSELNQIIGLAEIQKDAFEACWSSVDQLRSSNRFAVALFRRLEQKRLGNRGKWVAGAALIYQIRCAIVHAGEKDLIFERFPDGGEVIEEIMPHIERAALLILGVELS